MKKVTMLLFFVMILMLAACGQGESSDSVDGNEDEIVEETAVTTNVQDESEGEEPTGKPRDAANEQGKNGVNAESILRKSYEVMSELTSVHMSATMGVKEEMDGVKVIEKKEIEMTMLLQEPYSKHFALEIESNMADPIISEVYEMPDSHYIHSSVQDVNWGTIANPNGSQELSPHIAETSLEDHLAYSHQFEVSKDENYYELTFSGTYDEFMSAVYGGTIDMLQTIGKELPMELKDVINAHKIIIDKDTYYVKYYNTHYEGQVPEDQGEYVIVMDTGVTIDEYNEHDEIVVPQEVIDEAVTMMDNAGNSTMGN